MSNDRAEPRAGRGKPARRRGVDPATGLDAEAVRAFLLDNPDFLTEDPEFMRAYLERLDRSRGENVISLSAAMVSRAAAMAREYEANRQEMIENARQNMEVMTHVRAAALMALSADSLSALAEMVAGSFRALLEVESAFLAIEGFKETRRVAALRPLPEGCVAKITGRVALLRPADPRLAHLHRQMEPPIASEAVIPFTLHDGRDGALMFGSTNAERFQPEQAVDMLEFLAAVLARCIDRFEPCRA